MKKMTIYYLPTNVGQKKAGVKEGPEYLKSLGMLERLIEKGYEITEETIGLPTGSSDWDMTKKMARELKRQVSHNQATDLKLFVGGDHSLAFSTLSALEVDEESVVIWFDAHPDMNTVETSDTQNIHGMPLAYALGYGEEEIGTSFFSKKLVPENVFLVGIRSIDEGEKQRIQTTAVNDFSMEQIKKNPDWMEVCIKQIAQKNKPVHLSFDIDSLDKVLVPGTGTPVAGGFSEAEVIDFMTQLKEAVTIASIDFVEVNPELDSEHQTGERALRILEAML